MDGINLCFDAKTNVWSVSVTGYSMFIRIGLCLFAAGIPNGIKA